MTSSLGIDNTVSMQLITHRRVNRVRVIRAVLAHEVDAALRAASNKENISPFRCGTEDLLFMTSDFTGVGYSVVSIDVKDADFSEQDQDAADAIERQLISLIQPNSHDAAINFLLNEHINTTVYSVTLRSPEGFQFNLGQNGVLTTPKFAVGKVVELLNEF